MNLTPESFGLTDIGKRRGENEDQFFIAEFSGSLRVHQTSIPIDDCSTMFGDSQGYLFLVADGLGGHVGGARASTLAISAAATHALNCLQWLTLDHVSKEEVEVRLQRIADDCQRRLSASAQRQPDEYGMATTLTFAIVLWPNLYLMHIGDSRCYLLRNACVKRLTRDHTLGQLYAEVAAKDKEVSPTSHVLWNVVSSEEDQQAVADVCCHELEEGDRLILCTDGLSNHLDEDEIAQVVSDQPVREACEKLVDLANQRGGDDNITTIVSHFRARPRERKDGTAMVETRVPMDSIIDDPALDGDRTDEFVAFCPETPPSDSGEQS